MKKPFTLMASAILFLASCGTEKQADNNETPADTAAVNDAEAVPDEMPAKNIHPVSDWAERHPQHDFFYNKTVDDLVNGKSKYAPSPEEEMDYTHDHLNKTEMDKLSTRDLLYYCLKYPCSFSQICAADEFPDSTGTPKIRAYLPWDYSGAMMSEWQVKALEKKRDSVIIVLNGYMENNPDRIDREFLELLLHLKSCESIPVIAKTASSENLNNYTYLLMIMNDQKYAPFMAAGMYRQLYGENSYTYGNRIEASQQNLDSIKTFSMELYRSKK